MCRQAAFTSHTAPYVLGRPGQHPLRALSAKMVTKILGMGNPLLDISASVDTDLLEKYALDANSQILAEDKHVPLYKDLKSNYEVDYIPGGATQNAIRVAQWLLPEGITTYMGCVGDDEFGRIMKEKAEAEKVRVNYMVDPTTPTGTCAVLITNKTNRSLVAYLAAANNYKINHVQQPENWACVEEAGIYYMAGFFLTVSPDTILHVAEQAAKNNKIFSMNLSAPFLCQFFKEPMLKAAPYWDFIFGNEAEAEAFADNNDFGNKDVKEIALKIAALPKVNTSRPRVVVITQGPLPTVVCVNGTVTEYPVEQLAKEQIIDTNAAGDAFVGGFLAQLAQGKDIADCVRCGQYAAKEIIQQSGCTLPAAPAFN